MHLICCTILLLALHTSFSSLRRCAACKNQRRKCPPDCIFSPYFPANDPQRFASVHRIYGGSNVGKMLQEIPPYLREEAANTLYFEAQCRIQEPIYGCVGIIYKLHQQIQNAEIELAKVQTQIAFHKLQIPQEANNNESNLLNNDRNILFSTFGGQSNFDALPSSSSQRSNMEHFQYWGHSTMAPNWFN